MEHDATPAPAENLANRYRIEKQLGAGPDGVSYLAKELAGGAQVEVHVIDKAFTRPEQRSRLIARLRIAQLLPHSGKLDILELLVDQSPPAIACEVAPRQSLVQQRELDLPTTLSIAIQLCDCLAAAHRLGLYHGNLTLDNVLLDASLNVRLDFSGLQTGRNKTGQLDSLISVASLDGDIERLGQTLQWMLVDRTPISAHAPVLNGREFAALKQLLKGTRHRSTVDSIHAADFAARLVALRKQWLPAADPMEENSVAIQEGAADSPSANDTLVFGTEEIPSNLEPTTDTPIPVPSASIHKADTECDPNDEPLAANSLARHLAPLRSGDQIGRYRIERKLGEGGMGTVFQATDLGSNATVAIKVLHAAMLARNTSLKRFHKEARMLAKVNNPYVANLIEVNEDNGRHFLALEFVSGITLKRALFGHRPLEQQVALQVIADVARALVDAHELGIVHRDIKPDNIHLNELESATGDRKYAVKLLDFGIAREIDQTESMALTQQGVMLGTPLYMSPEQCKGQGEIGPQADVYALGITLFEMLTGHTPFAAGDPMKLAAMHCFDAPPDICKKKPEVTEAVAAIVNKALAKRPADRFADAAHFLREVNRLLAGDATDVAVHPLMPVHDDKQLFQLELEWELESSPQALWPYVSNTDRLNRAVGLPAATFRTEVDPAKGIRKFGSFKLAGVKVAWEEHPYEWIEGCRMGVLREFQSGPFLWFMSTVELEPIAGGGTRLKHGVRIAPRNLLGSLLAKVEADWKGRRALDRVYRRIDEVLKGASHGILTSDPFESASPLPTTRQQRLQERTSRLIGRGVPADLAGKLSEFLATASPQDVAKIRPIALADRLQVEQDSLLQACLLATVEGLLTLGWDVLCPTCRAPSEAKVSLKELQKHTYCEACDINFESNLANSVELVFQVHPELRQADTGQYCVGGPWHAPHVVAQLRLDPGERIELETQLPPGEYLLRGPRLARNLTISVRESGAPSHADISLRADSDARRSLAIRSGKQVLELTNQYQQLQVVRLERTLPRHDLVTAAQASALPLFRKLFPRQVLDAGQLVTAEQITLLVTTIENVDALYAQLGDADAFALIQRHTELLEEVIRQAGGALVKVVGEGVEAAWHDCLAAVKAATTMQQTLNTNENTEQIQLSIGVHRGPALVTTVNDRLDYFGATARAAANLPEHAHGGIVLTQAVYSDPEVTQLIQQDFPSSTIRSVDLPGAPRSLLTHLSASPGGKEKLQ